MCGEAAGRVRVVPGSRRDRLHPAEETLLELFVFPEVLPENFARSRCGILKLGEEGHEEGGTRAVRVGQLGADFRDAPSEREQLRDDLRKKEPLAEPGPEVRFE